VKFVRVSATDANVNVNGCADLYSGDGEGCVSVWN
jgi:hypothetical protein